MIIIRVEMVELMEETVIKAHMRTALVLRTLVLPAQAAHMVEGQVEPELVMAARLHIMVLLVAEVLQHRAAVIKE